MHIHQKQRVYQASDTAARFLLGGIGTGSISIDSRAHLCDFELGNRPQKGHTPPYTFFAVHSAPTASDADPQASLTKLLEVEPQPPYTGSHGLNAWEYGGLPRFRDSRMTSQYPFVRHELLHPEVPLDVELEAFTPFIPLDADRSGIPVAIMTWSITNRDTQPRSVSVAASMANITNHQGYDVFSKPLYGEDQVNETFTEEGIQGIRFRQTTLTEAHHRYMEMGLALADSPEGEIALRPNWAEGQWWDGVQDFWNDFSDDGQLDPESEVEENVYSIHHSPFKIGSVARKHILQPGETAEWRFLITWYRPNRIKSWNQNLPPIEPDSAEPLHEHARPLIRNYYAHWGNPLAVSRYVTANYDELYGLSRAFADALYSSTLPEPVIDAVASTLTVIRSTTCARVEGGRFYAFEGCFDHEGACHGNCSHVWNYAQTLAYLFPELERSMRRTEFLEEVKDDGHMNFRAQTWLDGWQNDFLPASDGALGSIVRVYREWKLSGDDDFLRELWPNMKKVMGYAERVWDPDGDGVLEGPQHNTYDIDFFGVSTLPNAIYLASLRAAQAMASYLDEAELAAHYGAIAARGAKLLDEYCYNGEYYVQNMTVGTEPGQDPKYQYGNGVLSDQLLGQTWAFQQGLGYLLPEEHVQSAAQAIFEHNYITDFHEFVNLQRTYALRDDKGLVLCTWPEGDRPRIPFVYSDEVWSGVEYSVASLLVYTGRIDEALTLVEATRARHDGHKRSPWDEVECGHHYARSLASYGVWVALTGFEADLPAGELRFAPKLNHESFQCFFSCAAGWGVFTQTYDDASDSYHYSIETLYGDLSDLKLVVEPQGA